MSRRPPESKVVVGQRYGRWTVVSYHGLIGSGQRAWVCNCDCGTVRVVRADRLIDGTSKSCSCLRNPMKGEACKTPGYTVWAAIKDRCRNPNSSVWHRYGGRGITLCDRWDSFINFIADMGLQPEGLQLDRIDNNLGYSKENCRWVTSKQNNRNRRDNHLITFDGRTLTLAEWGEIAGINPLNIYRRLKAGWELERALTEPSRDAGGVYRGRPGERKAK